MESEQTFNAAVGAAIRDIREAQGVTQGRLADLLTVRGLPFRQQTVAKVESGQRPLRLEEAAAMADALEVAIDDLTAERGSAGALLVRQAGHDLRESWERVVQEVSDTFLRGLQLKTAMKTAGDDGEAGLASIVEAAHVWLETYRPDRALEAGRRVALAKAIAFGHAEDDLGDLAAPVAHGGWPIQGGVDTSGQVD